MSNTETQLGLSHKHTLQTTDEAASSRHSSTHGADLQSQTLENLAEASSSLPGAQGAMSQITEVSGKHTAGSIGQHADQPRISNRAAQRVAPYEQVRTSESDDSDHASVQRDFPKDFDAENTYTTHRLGNRFQLNGEEEEEEQYVLPLDDFDLGAPIKDGNYIHSLESFSDLLFADEHLKNIFADPNSMSNFACFVSSCQPESAPLLKYYLDATNSLRAVNDALAMAESLQPIQGHDFTSVPIQSTLNVELEGRITGVMSALAQEVLPSFVTHMYVQTVKSVMARRIISAVTVPQREALEGVLEAFCLTDPSRPDNPIVFASEGFHQISQYNMNYVIGRNCRFLQGPKTSKLTVQRIRQTLGEGKEHCDLVLNYRRDGSPFVNLLMMAPLRDINGKIRYVLGAQIDVSNLAPDSTAWEDETTPRKVSENVKSSNESGQMQSWASKSIQTDSRSNSPSGSGEWNRPGILLKNPATLVMKPDDAAWISRKMGGFYHNYLLLRPFPSLRILFASPSLQVPGMLQSPVTDKIGASPQVRDELVSALAQGRSVTAKVRWAPRLGDRGRSRWIAFTPLVGSNKQIGVWIAILIDEEATDEQKSKQAPPVRFRVGPTSQAKASKKIIGSIPEEIPVDRDSSRPPSRMPDKGPQRAHSMAKELPPPPPASSLRRPTPSPPEEEEEEGYESLEVRLRKKRERDAARLQEKSGPTAKPTYKSLSPYAFLNNNNGP